jgi:hypothetical protein
MLDWFLYLRHPSSAGNFWVGMTPRNPAISRGFRLGEFEGLVKPASKVLGEWNFLRILCSSSGGVVVD